MTGLFRGAAPAAPAPDDHDDGKAPLRPRGGSEQDGAMGDTGVRAFGLTDVGLVRAANEDSFTMAELSKASRWQGGKCADWPTTKGGVLLVVSDGMGGAKAGEVASALSVEAVLGGMLRAVREKPVDGDVLRKVIEQASEKVHEAGKRADRKGMGATLTAVLVTGTTAYVAQIGDSRAYLLRNGKIGQVTHDLSYVQMLVDAGVMTAAEAEASPRKNIILQVMGQEAVRVVLGRIAEERRPPARLLRRAHERARRRDPQRGREGARGSREGLAGAHQSHQAGRRARQRHGHRRRGQLIG